MDGSVQEVSMNFRFKIQRPVPGQDLAGNLWLRDCNVPEARRSVRFQVESLKVVQHTSRIQPATPSSRRAPEDIQTALYIGDVSARELHSR